MARMEIGKEHTEFGAGPGMYTDGPDDFDSNSQTRGPAYLGATAIKQTDSTDPTAVPRYGDGGKRVQ